MPDELDFGDELNLKPSRGSSKRGGRGGLFVVFLLGLALGIGGTLAAPRLVGRYVPEAVRGTGEEVTGEVRGKKLDGERLLLTVVSPAGAMLATFQKRVPEIDLLVEAGDTVTLEVARYEPFVKDPAVRGVRKTSTPRDGKEAAPREEEEAAEPPPSGGVEADTSSANQEN